MAAAVAAFVVVAIAGMLMIFRPAVTMLCMIVYLWFEDWSVVLICSECGSRDSCTLQCLIKEMEHHCDSIPGLCAETKARSK